MSGQESAFPTNETEYARQGDVEHSVTKCVQPGLSKREYFAAHALQGLLSAIDDYGPGRLIPTEEAAVDAVAMADALIEELKKNVRG